MNDRKISREFERELVAKIVSNYVKHNSITVNDLPSVIASVHQSLGNLGKSSPSVEVPTPAVPIRRSVTSDYVVCLECGFAARCSGGICASSTASSLQPITPVGSCRQITRSLRQRIRRDARRWPRSLGLVAVGKSSRKHRVGVPARKRGRCQRHHKRLMGCTISSTLDALPRGRVFGGRPEAID